MDVSCSSDDMAILVESLKSYETLESHTRQQAFGAIRSLLCSSEMAQNYFRELKGVELMMAIYQHYKKYNHTEVIENVIYTLAVAVEQNDTTRQGLLREEMFTMIKESIGTVLIPSSFLLLCLTSNNVTGQDFSRTTHCINKLCHLLKTNIENEHETEEAFKTCNASCTNLCAIISNPVNKLNQDICCRLLLPTLVRCLSKNMDRQLLQSLIKLTGSCVIENSEAQTYFCVIGGIRALFAVISTCLSHKLQSPCDFQFMTYLVNTLSCSYANHAVNKMKVLEMDVIEGLLGCLQACSDQKQPNHLHVVQLQITSVTALLTLFDDSDSVLGLSKEKFQDNGGTVAVVELLTCTKDENLKKLATALLHRTLGNEDESNDHSKDISPNKRHDISNSTVDMHERSTASPDTIKNGNSSGVVIKRRPNYLKDNPSDQMDNGCCCRVRPYVDSHNAVKVLTSGLLCSYHTALGHKMLRYIAERKSQT